MKKIGLFTGLILAVIGIQIVCGYVLLTVFHDWHERAAFGEMFTVVHALFDGLAFAALVFTVLVQDKEISSQKEIQTNLVIISAIAARLNANYAFLDSQNREYDRLLAEKPEAFVQETQLEKIRKVEMEIEKLLSELDSFEDPKT